jgi:hypothetical protein
MRAHQRQCYHAPRVHHKVLQLKVAVIAPKRVKVVHSRCHLPEYPPGHRFGKRPHVWRLTGTHKVEELAAFAKLWRLEEETRVCAPRLWNLIGLPQHTRAGVSARDRSIAPTTPKVGNRVKDGHPHRTERAHLATHHTRAAVVQWEGTC